MGPYSLWGDVRLKYFLLQRFKIVDSCHFTGPYISVQGFRPGGKVALDDGCPHVRGFTYNADGDGIDRVSSEDWACNC